MKTIVVTQSRKNGTPMTQRITNLKHGDLVIIAGRKGEVGTVGGYAVEYNEDPLLARARATAGKELMAWVNQNATCISGDKGYYAEKIKWASAINLADGDLAWLDGQLWRIKYMGDYSVMVHFRPV